MAITDTTHLERVLIVLNPDGTLKAACAQSLRVVSDGDTILSAHQLDPVAIDGAALQAVIPTAPLLAQLQTMTVERDAALADKAQSIMERDTAVSQSTELATQIQTATTSLTAAAGSLSQAVADRDAAMAHVADLTARLAAAGSRIAELEGTGPVVNGVPQRVTPYQARMALLNAGLLDQVTAAVNQAGGAAVVAWEYATTVERQSPFIASISASLNLTSEQVDALFVAAAAIA